MRSLMRLVTITRLVVILAIIGVVGYDAFSCMSTRVNTENDAQNAAFAASQAWHDYAGNSGVALQLAYQAAVAAVIDNKAETVQPTDFTVDADGTVHLIIDRTAKTVVFHRIGLLKHWVTVAEHGDANSVN
jgi:uncharacterized protein (UPF0333 family)